MLQGKTEQIKLCQGAQRLQGRQGQTVFTQLGSHVGPGGVNPLRHSPIERIDRMIEHRHADMAHTHFIDVGKSQSKADLHRREIFGHRTELTAQISTRPTDPT